MKRSSHRKRCSAISTETHSSAILLGRNQNPSSSSSPVPIRLDAPPMDPSPSFFRRSPKLRLSTRRQRARYRHPTDDWVGPTPTPDQERAHEPQAGRHPDRPTTRWRRALARFRGRSRQLSQDTARQDERVQECCKRQQRKLVSELWGAWYRRAQRLLSLGSRAPDKNMMEECCHQKGLRGKDCVEKKEEVEDNSPQKTGSEKTTAEVSWWLLRTDAATLAYCTGNPTHRWRVSSHPTIVNGSPSASHRTASSSGNKSQGSRSTGSDRSRCSTGSDPIVQEAVQVRCTLCHASETWVRGNDAVSTSKAGESRLPTLLPVGSKTEPEISAAGSPRHVNVEVPSPAAREEIGIMDSPPSPSLMPRPLFSTPLPPSASPLEEPPKPDEVPGPSSPARAPRRCSPLPRFHISRVISSLRPHLPPFRPRKSSTSTTAAPPAPTAPPSAQARASTSHATPTTLNPDIGAELTNLLRALSAHHPDIVPSAPPPTIGAWAHQAPTSYMPLPLPDDPAVVSALIDRRRAEVGARDLDVRAATVEVLGVGLEERYGGEEEWDWRGREEKALEFWAWERVA